jgi:hypothetical protein
MAKLNQKELKALTIEVEKMIEESVQKFTDSEQYSKLVNATKKEIKYDESTVLVKKISSLVPKRNKLNEELQDLRETLSELCQIKTFSAIPDTTEKLDKRLKICVQSKILGKYPTTEEIEHKLTLLNLQGSTDLLTLIKTDLGL